MHNPLRSEAEMFRVVVIVGIALLPVIVLGLAAGPGWGAGLLVIEIAAAAYWIWRTSRGSEPHTADVAHDDDAVYRLLVVANETVAGRALLSEIERRCAAHDRSEILVVVPALTSSRLEHLAHDVDGAIAEARERLDRSLATMRAAGLSARGEVGDHHDPNVAIEDALRTFAADEVIVSTHPPQRSKWLERGVVERARTEIPLRVTHVVVDLAAEDATAARSAS
jgi:hypothetical protein